MEHAGSTDLAQTLKMCRQDVIEKTVALDCKSLYIRRKRIGDTAELHSQIF